MKRTKKTFRKIQKRKRTQRKQKGGSIQTPITIEQAKNMGVVVNPIQDD